MEPKMEQPKQYTPEEITRLEKSRTVSDAELLKGGAEYVVNEKGEKENLLITSEQKSNIHKEFEETEKFEKERQEYIEKKAFYEQVVTRYVFSDLNKFFKNKKLRYPGKVDSYDSFDQATAEFLKDLRLKFIDEVKKSYEKENVKSFLIESSGPESLFSCAGCLVGYFDRIGHSELYNDDLGLLSKEV